LIYPVFFNVYMAVSQWSWSTPINQPKPFVGLMNFAELASSPIFLNSFWVTLQLVLSATAIEYALGLAVALVLNSEFRGRGIFRSIFILPMMLAPIVVGIQWQYLLSGNFSVIGYVLERFGLPVPNPLSNPRLALPTLVLVDAWTYVPFVALVLLAGMQQIPNELYEAAQVDGANPVDRIRYITLPLLRPATLLVLLLRSGQILRTFDVVYVLTGGGPGRSTEVLGILLYHIAFGEGDMGEAAALAIIIGLAGMMIGGVLLNAIRTEVRVV